MRFFHNLVLAALVAVAVAQGQGGASPGNPNPFLTPSGGLKPSVGQPITLNWNPTTQGTITLRLQWGPVPTPTQGIVIAASIPNSGSFTWTPSSSLPNEPNFTIEIVDDQAPNQVNYSHRFTITGATGTTTPASSSPTSSGSSSATSSSTSSSATPSSSSASSNSKTSSTSTSSSSSSSTPSSTPTPTPTPTPASTSAPPPNNSGSSNAPSALMGLLLGLVALL